MISKKSIAAWAKKLHVDEAALKAAMDDDKEIDVNAPATVTAFTADELKTRDKAKYDDGTVAGEEIAVKEIKKEHSLDFKGKKVKDLFEHASTAGQDKEVVTKLRKNITDLEKERDDARIEAGNVRLQSKIHAFIPDLNNGLNKAEAESILRANGYDFKEEGGVIVPYKNGAKVKDEKLQTDIPADKAITDFFTEKKMTGDVDDNTGAKGGRAGGDSKSKAKPAFTRSSEVEKAFNEKHGPGASMGTEHDYAGHLGKIMKEADEAGTPLIMD